MNVNRDILLFVALALAWGTSFAAIEVGLATLPPILFAAFRFDVAAALFVAAVVALGLEWRPRTRSDLALIAVGGGLVIGAHFALLFVGQSYVSSGVAAIILSLTPIVTPPLALALLPRERIRAPAAVGLLLGLAGVVVIATDGGALGGQAIGVALLFASAVVFALGAVLTARVSGTLPLISLQAWSMAIGAALLHGLSAVHPAESIAAVEWTTAALVALAYLAVVATGGGFLAYFVLLERIGATEISMVNYAVPVVAAVFGWAVLGESLTLATIVGFALIVLGFGLCKIGALWRTVAPVVGYGPHRPSTAAAGVVVKGNVYVTGTDRYAGPAQSAD
ncbi:DMT family transporter [Natrononativus amylolyticus]|uniref:DMT family transporter n=1 Tax=Natrononativus amylolyticus TaxID=2963434 RepID=UPI0020CEE1DA|nr:DMT family transporter [Natrononativus amylolyticus]